MPHLPAVSRPLPLYGQPELQLRQQRHVATMAGLADVLTRHRPRLILHQAQHRHMRQGTVDGLATFGDVGISGLLTNLKIYSSGEEGVN